MKTQASFYVAGVSFEGRQEQMKELATQFAKDNTPKPVQLVPEPENEHDLGKAIRVEAFTRTGWLPIGYVPRTANEEIGKMLTAKRIENARLVSVGRPAFDKPIGGKVVFDVEVV